MKELWTIETVAGFEKAFKNLRKRHPQSTDRALVKIEGTSGQGDKGRGKDTRTARSAAPTRDRVEFLPICRVWYNSNIITK